MNGELLFSRENRSLTASDFRDKPRIIFFGGSPGLTERWSGTQNRVHYNIHYNIIIIVFLKTRILIFRGAGAWDELIAIARTAIIVTNNNSNNNDVLMYSNYYYIVFATNRWWLNKWSLRSHICAPRFLVNDRVGYSARTRTRIMYRTRIIIIIQQ